jgi:hypothetical protein
VVMNIVDEVPTTSERASCQPQRQAAQGQHSAIFARARKKDRCWMSAKVSKLNVEKVVYRGTRSRRRAANWMDDEPPISVPGRANGAAPETLMTIVP